MNYNHSKKKKSWKDSEQRNVLLKIGKRWRHVCMIIIQTHPEIITNSNETFIQIGA